jgi:hypothetical protein
VTDAVEGFAVGRAPILWADGDPWRDLTGEAAAAGALTVISEHGTARFIDFARHRHIREPLEGGKALLGDWVWLPFDYAEITPCGVVLARPEFWGTPLRLVLGGIVDEWMDTEPGRAAVTASVSRRAPMSAGHPAEPCGARYCTIRPG